MTHTCLGRLQRNTFALRRTRMLNPVSELTLGRKSAPLAQVEAVTKVISVYVDREIAIQSSMDAFALAKKDTGVQGSLNHLENLLSAGDHEGLCSFFAFFVETRGYSLQEIDGKSGSLAPFDVAIEFFLCLQAHFFASDTRILTASETRKQLDLTRKLQARDVCLRSLQVLMALGFARNPKYGKRQSPEVKFRLLIPLLGPKLAQMLSDSAQCFQAIHEGRTIFSDPFICCFLFPGESPEVAIAVKSGYSWMYEALSAQKKIPVSSLARLKKAISLSPVDLRGTLTHEKSFRLARFLGFRIQGRLAVKKRKRTERKKARGFV